MISGVLLGAVGVILLLALAGVGWKWTQERRKLAESQVEIQEEDIGAHEGIDVRTSWLGLITAWRRQAKAKRLAKKGYVKWYLLGSGIEGPKWIKPERDGTGVAKYRHDDEPYLFPADELVIDKSTGAWVAMHHEGEAYPVPIKEPEIPQMDADRLREVTDLTAESEPPSWLSNLDLSTGQMVMGGIALLFIAFAGVRMMG